MNSGIDPWTKILLLKAAEDEATIQIEALPDGPFGFHAQQAVEKLMKALLSQLSIGLDYTHNVENLARQLSDAGETLPTKHAGLSEMNRLSVAYRYDAIPDMEIQDRPAIIASVRQIREHVLARISTLSGVPLPPPLQ
ncbi:MAG: HEPN domain-containing protein [Terracidiphilus sp.]